MLNPRGIGAAFLVLVMIFLLVQDQPTARAFDISPFSFGDDPQDIRKMEEETLTPPPGTVEAPATPPRIFPFVEKRYRKNIVEVPPEVPPRKVQPGEFRDPFFLIRGTHDNAKEALDPGTTVDGVRFSTYADSPESVEKYYRDSNFTLDDVFGRILVDNRDTGCQFCHHGIEEISANHKMECTTCHGGNSKTRNRRRAHRKMVSNPSAPEHAEKYCGDCHAEQVEWMKRSLMTTARGMIDLTRHAWGVASQERPGEKPEAMPEEVAKQEGDKGRKGEQSAQEKGEEVQAQTSTPPSPEALRVQGFLDKKCLRCHLDSEAPRRAGDYRASGCAGCHMIYTNDGTTLTRDRAVQRSLARQPDRNADRFRASHAAKSLSNRRGYPVIHQMTVAVPSVQCEHCHNYNGVGNEFEGLFGRPARPRDSAELLEKDTPLLYGRQHDFLVPDIHREKGMHCIDCHAAMEMKADAGQFKTLHDAVRIRCEDCHGTPEKSPEGRKLAPSNPAAKKMIKNARLNPNLKRRLGDEDTVLVTGAGVVLPHVRFTKKGWVLTSKVTGRSHQIPQLREEKNPPTAHRIAAHVEKVECHACHARWSANEWGMHAIRQPSMDQDLWKDWSFSDPVLMQKLRGNTEGDGGEPDGMFKWTGAESQRDRLKSDWTEGLWITLFAQSDWSRLILGKNTRGKVSVLKPRYQYFITDRMAGDDGEQARVPEATDGTPGWVLTPHVPHTIRSVARTCESCHQNEVAAGRGEDIYMRVPDAATFRRSWLEEKRIPDSMQLRQLVAEDGTPLQSVLPEPARTLVPQETEALLKPGQDYKAARYLDSQETHADRLISRNHFPYDKLHELNKRKYGPPQKEEDLYYDSERHRFVLDLPPGMDAEPEADEPEPETQPLVESVPRTPPPGIREYSPELFTP